MFDTIIQVDGKEIRKLAEAINALAKSNEAKPVSKEVEAAYLKLRAQITVVDNLIPDEQGT
jgi:hypothetical protein